MNARIDGGDVDRPAGLQQDRLPRVGSRTMSGKTSGWRSSSHPGHLDQAITPGQGAVYDLIKRTIVFPCRKACRVSQ